MADEKETIDKVVQAFKVLQQYGRRKPPEGQGSKREAT